MVNTINMQDMRHLNLFNKITRVNTRFCSSYNDTLIFFVPKLMVSRAIGPEGINIKKINSILRKRVKVIPSPKGIEDAKKFIENIVSPVTFKGIEVTPEEIILTAGPQSKAALIGRNKRRLIEMQRIVSDFFKKDFRIV